MVGPALNVAQRLKDEDIDLEVVNASTIRPLDGLCLSRLRERGKPVFTLEEHVLDGGFGSSVLEYNAAHGGEMTVHPIAVEDRFISQGGHDQLLKDAQLDEESLSPHSRGAVPAGSQQ